MRHVAEATQVPLEELYQRIAWPLNKKYGHSHDAFKIAITYVPSLLVAILYSCLSIFFKVTAMSGTMSISPPRS